MRITIISPCEHKQMPWKNGKGMTREIAIFPPEATVAKNDFLWRFSSATVGESGPFSEFPGCERFLTVLSGDGLDIDFENETKFVDARTVLEFSGERAASGRLRSGPVTDLNLIYKRGRVRAAFRLAEPDETLSLAPGTSLVFVCRGRLSLENAGELETFGMARIELDKRALLKAHALERGTRIAVISLMTP